MMLDPVPSIVAKFQCEPALRGHMSGILAARAPRFRPLPYIPQGYPVFDMSAQINSYRSHYNVMKVWSKEIGGVISVRGLNVRFDGFT